MRLFDWGRQIFHVAYIPLILYLGTQRASDSERAVFVIVLGVANLLLKSGLVCLTGYTRSNPRPSLLRLISPLAA